jgi:hypothetical protein
MLLAGSAADVPRLSPRRSGNSAPGARVVFTAVYVVYSRFYVNYCQI